MSDLVEHGIRTEKSHYRAHVSVVNECVMLFPTVEGVDALQRGTEKTASQEGVEGITSRARTVPIQAIRGLRVYKVDNECLQRWRERDPDEFSTSEKGAVALAVVKAFLSRRGVAYKEVLSSDQQISGADLVVNGCLVVQVKMDWRGGPLPLGTGNVYLEEAERNPLKRW